MYGFGHPATRSSKLTVMSSNSSVVSGPIGAFGEGPGSSVQLPNAGADVGDDHLPCAGWTPGNSPPFCKGELGAVLLSKEP